MAGFSPSPDFLAQLNAQLGTLGNPAAPAPLPAPMPAPIPPPAHQGGPSISWLGPAGPSLGAPAQQPPADPFGLMQPQPAAPAPAPAPPPAPPSEVTPVDPRLMPQPQLNTDAIPSPQPAAPAEAAPDVQFRQTGGGAIPAHEAALRGPTQNAHLMASFEDPLQAADRMEGRSRWQAEEERNFYELQASKAMEQQAAAEKVALQRQAHMERLAMDYEDQVQRLGQMHLDSNRWWSTKSTGDKIATGVIAFLGGLGALDPRGNGRNLAYEAIMRDADADVEAQKFDYMVQQGQAQGAQNAFAMAMDRYHNEDAAHAVARAAALDFTLGKVGELQAQWKGVESANAADDLRARLLSERERTIAAGIRFVPAQASPGRYQMMVRGQMAPGTFSEKEAQQVFMEHQVKPAEKYDEQTLGIGGQMAIEDRKATHAAAKGQKELTVRLPTGEVVTAPTPAEHKELTDLAASVQETNRLVARAMQLREEGFRTKPGNMGELKSIQQQLRVQAGVQGKLGALAAEDLKIVDGEIGALSDPLAISSAPERALQAWQEKSNAMLRQRVSTYPDASSTARGDLSGAKSLKFRGK